MWMTISLQPFTTFTKIPRKQIFATSSKIGGGHLCLNTLEAKSNCARKKLPMSLLKSIGKDY